MGGGGQEVKSRDVGWTVPPLLPLQQVPLSDDPYPHSPTRTERATSVLLADPCFQLRSICYLLGQPEPPAPGTALPPPDRKRFSLQSCEWARGGSGIWGWARSGVSRANPQVVVLKRHWVLGPHWV